VRTGLTWKNGEFPRRSIGGYSGLFATEQPWGSLHPEVLERVVEDARSRGKLMDNERSRVSLTIDTTAEDTPVIVVEVSDDPAARGVYDLNGTWLRSELH